MNRMTKLIDRMRANNPRPESDPTIATALCCGDEGIFIKRAGVQERIDDPKELEDQPPRLVPMDITGEQVDDDDVPAIWRRIENEHTGQQLSAPRVFIERATTGGIYCIVEGVQYFIRYRYLHREAGEDRPLLCMLEFMGVRTEIGPDFIYFDFSDLPQTGLKFWQRRKGSHDDVSGMVLKVHRQSRTCWSMVKA